MAYRKLKMAMHYFPPAARLWGWICRGKPRPAVFRTSLSLGHLIIVLCTRTRLEQLVTGLSWFCLASFLSLLSILTNSIPCVSLCWPLGVLVSLHHPRTLCPWGIPTKHFTNTIGFIAETTPLTACWHHSSLGSNPPGPLNEDKSPGIALPDVCKGRIVQTDDQSLDHPASGPRRALKEQ